MNLPESMGKEVLGLLDSTRKDETGQNNFEQKTPEKDPESSSSREINLNESPPIVIEDLELIELIESVNFDLGDYIVLNNDLKLGSSLGNSDLESVKTGGSEVFLYLDKEGTTQIEDEAVGEVNIINESNDVHKDNKIGCESHPNKSSLVNDNSEKVDDVDPHENNNICENYVEINLQSRPRKGRKRKFEGQTREIKKTGVNLNEDYINVKGDVKYTKEFKDYHCDCKLKCNQEMSCEERHEMFNSFYKAGSYEARCFLIQTMVKEVPIKRKRVKESDKKTVSREYYLLNQRVCKQMFMQTLGVTSCVIDKALKKKKKGSMEDGRGKSGGRKKLPDPKIKGVIYQNLQSTNNTIVGPQQKQNV